MTTTPQSPFDLLREIKPDLKNLDTIPLTGNSSPFPWEEFSSRLQKVFDRKELLIEPGEMTWRSSENLFEGLGDHLLPLTFSVPPLKGQIYWIMPEQEIDILAALLMTKDSHPLSLHDPELIESFYRFLALEVLFQFTELSTEKTLTPLLAQKSSLPKGNALSRDISINIHGRSIWGRLIISPDFRQSWVEYFAKKTNTTQQSQELAKLAEVFIHLEAGRTNLTLKDWTSVKLGDFISLDNCLLDPENWDGRIILSVNGRQAFSGKLKKGNIKILEYSLLQEVDNPMAKRSDDEENESEFDEEFEEDDDLFSETEEDDEDEDVEDEEEDDDLFSETESELEETEEESHEYTDDDENETDNALMETEEDFTEETEDPIIEKDLTETEEEANRLDEEGKKKSDSQRKPISPSEIPVTLVVEVGQIQMTMDRLLKLEPGNMLELNMHPDKGVDLTINGRVVGKGELIKIGESIGVRVLQLG